MPSEERDREALFEQEAIAEAPVLRREIALARGTHQAERLVATAVDDLQEHRAAHSGSVLRKKEQQVACEFDLAGGVPGSGAEIGNRLIGGEPRIDGVVHAGDHPFVRPKIVAAAHLDPDNFS